jgi:hypothetical protein
VATKGGRPTSPGSGNARQARHLSLLEDLESAHGDLQRCLPAAKTDSERREILGAFLRELIRTTRADSRILEHPVVLDWVRNARAWGWRKFLKQLPGTQERGVRPALRQDDLALLAAVDDLRWPPSSFIPAGRGATMTEQHHALRAKALRAIHAVHHDPELWKADTKATAAASKPIRSLRSIYQTIKKNPKTRPLLKAKRSTAVMSYQAFHELVADGFGKGGQIGKLRL